MLHVSHLRKEFTNIVAVDDVSFSVQPGQIFGLIGPNGAGKSTTIRMIMDIIQPDAGQVTIDGHPMNASAKNIIGYLPEERGLYRKNKLINVISYFGALKGLTPRAARDAARPLLDLFDLTKYENRNIEELSKGNQQKVQFIISILHQPRLLVLDELFAGLDPVNQVLMKDELLQLRRENRAIIFSTHQMDQAEKLCDDLMMINRGKTVLHGTPTGIKQQHGRNALHVEFTGDGSFLREIDGVVSVDLAQNYAEIELRDDVRTNDIVSAMLPRLELHHVARIEPSLQSIFITVVGRDNVAAGEDTATAQPAPPRMSSKDPRVRKPFVNMLIFFAVGLILSFNLREGIDTVMLLFVLAAFAGMVISYVKFTRARRELQREYIHEEEQK
ncbi:MAG: ATP-binding cassette domain-containing protein [Bacteroidetes bacterium]|nr:ATP-binding cassette domain-containing protein [Bacteroidota bacterium]